ncbi:MAG: acyl-coenzyme A thioesterase PaaI-like protein [Psychrobacter glaciei]|jgi:acyl-coenzyme A thioesterase PaaI-like protein
MNNKNRLTTAVSQIQRLPKSLHQFAMSKIFGNKIKYAGHSGIRFEALSEELCIVSIKNNKKVQNHIGGIHAAAMALLAETATGFVFGMNVPDSKLPLIKKMDIDYVKRSSGNMKAVASLTQEQILSIKTEEKGSVVVPVVITDEANVEPIKASMTWAWTSKR